MADMEVDRQEVESRRELSIEEATAFVNKLETDLRKHGYLQNKTVDFKADHSKAAGLLLESISEYAGDQLREASGSEQRKEIKQWRSEARELVKASRVAFRADKKAQRIASKANPTKIDLPSLGMPGINREDEYLK